MQQSSDRELDSTLAGLETGLRVNHIACFEMITCDAETIGREIMVDAAFSDFDHIPVKSSGNIVGVVDRQELIPERYVLDIMHPLNGSMVVSAEEPLANFIHLLQREKYRLVVRSADIQGIVTRSDLHKLPVRLYVFTRITHFELLMGRVLRKLSEGDENCIFRLLPAEESRKLKKELKNLGERKLNLLPVDGTSFYQKYLALAKHFGFGDEFTSELHDIKELRNDVAHGARYADNDAALENFFHRLEWIERWAADLKRRAEPV
jgi:hypothetical protein